MNLAYLILAHQNPLALKKLIEKLDHNGVCIFVHIDKKSEIKKFLSVIAKSNVVFLPNNKRVTVNWGAFGQVLATLNLIEFAYKYNVNFDRYCLLSGSDYPVKNNNEIISQLDSNVEYIRIDNVIDGYNHDSHFDNIQYYWFMDWPGKIKNLLKRKIKRKIYANIQSYYGSNWWCLTNDCITYILKFVKDNKAYMRFHRYTLCVDEIFFASIIKASPFAQNISHDFEETDDVLKFRESNIHACHYIDWNALDVSLPKVLDMNDAESIVKSSALFARKFEPDKSNELIDYLDMKTS